MAPLYCAAPGHFWGRGILHVAVSSYRVWLHYFVLRLVISEDVVLYTWQCHRFGDSRAGQMLSGALTLSSLGFIVSSRRGRQYQVVLVHHLRYST